MARGIQPSGLDESAWVLVPDAGDVEANDGTLDAYALGFNSGLAGDTKRVVQAT